jgi:hypothetical protein
MQNFVSKADKKGSQENFYLKSLPRPCQYLLHNDPVRDRSISMY